MSFQLRATALATRIGNYLRDSVVPRLLPTGGTTGQVLTKSSATNFATAWATPAAGGAVVDDLSASLAAYKAGPALSRIRSKRFRVLCLGTSIASFDISGIRLAAANLQEVYGRNETRVEQLGVYGGTWGTGGGVKKQTYGSAPPVRAVLQLGNTITREAFVDGFTVIYGKETGGGSFKVLIDDVEVATVSCAGAQSYGNVWSNTFPTRSFHKLTITGFTGNAYVERIEMRDDGLGVFVEDGTMGGTGLQHTVTMFSNSSGSEVASVPIVGWNGVSSLFSRPVETRPDIIFLQHYTNDTGATATVQTVMDQMAAMTKAYGTLVIVITENPALNYLDANGKLNPVPEAHRAMLMSYGNRENIIAVDWLKMADTSDMAAYEARAFPGSDKTHPESVMYLPLHSALSTILQTPAPGYDKVTALPSSYGPATQRGINPFVPDSYSNVAVNAGVGRADVTPFGGTMTAMARAGCMGNDSVFANVFLSSKVVNMVPKEYLDAIANSTSRDHYGPYVPAADDYIDVGRALPLTQSAQADVFTVCILARTKNPIGLGWFKMEDFGSARPLDYLVNGKVVSPGENRLGFSADRNEPRYYYINFRRGSAEVPMQFWIQVSQMDLYGIWAVEGPVPVVTSRIHEAARYIGFPGYMTGDAKWDLIEPGQVIAQAIPGKTPLMLKRATDGVVFKFRENKFARIYEVINRADHPVIPMLPINASGTLTYDQQQGVETYPSAEGVQCNIGAAVNGEQWTIGLRQFASFDGVYVRLYNGGNNTELFLKADGTWSTTNEPIYDISSGGRPRNLGITFTMPTGANATALGSNPQLRVNAWGPGEKVTPGWLVRGPSACY